MKTTTARPFVRSILLVALAVTILTSSTSVLAATAGTPSPSLTTAVAEQTVTVSRPVAARHLPQVAAAWQDAWNGTDPSRLGTLFTADGTYTDHAIGTTMKGRDQVSAWKQGTDQLISDVHISISEAFRHGDHVAIQSVYSGHINGAPTPFAVPMCTILDLRHGKISKNEDYYSLAAVLAQSGLPADWTPGTTQPQS